MIFGKFFQKTPVKPSLRSSSEAGKREPQQPRSELTRLQKENRVLREALAFYASEKNWEAGHKYRDPDDATIFVDTAESATSVDKGERARNTLSLFRKKVQKDQ